jgi:uncharacterized lipoprotein YmbA
MKCRSPDPLMKSLLSDPSFRRKPEPGPARCAVADRGGRDPGVRRDDVGVECRINPGRRAAVLGLAGLLAACVTTPPEPERYFRPDLAPPPARPPPKLRIVVEPFRVQGLYADRALVIREAGGSYRQAHRRSWIGPPSLLLGETLLDYLRAAYGADAVFPAQARVDGEITIRPQLRRFERVQAEAGDQALLAVEFIVSGPDAALLGNLVFEESVAAGPAARDYVAAQSLLLAQASARLLVLLDRLLPTPATAIP